MLVQVNNCDWTKIRSHMFLVGARTFDVMFVGTYMETTRFTKPGSRRP